MADSDYSAPVDQLLTLGKVEGHDGWLDCRELGIGPAQIPELIRMVTDMELHDADRESDAVWAPLHAWRALGQLHAVEAIDPLIELFEPLSEDDWATAELPTVMSMMGPAAVSPLSAYLADTSHPLLPRLTALESLGLIAKKYIEARTHCINLFIRLLESFKENDEDFNGFLVSELLDLRAKKALPIIAAAFDADAVSSLIVRWDSVQRDLGVPGHHGPRDVLRQTQNNS